MTLTTLARTAKRQVTDVAQEGSRRASTVASRLGKRDILAMVAIAAGGFTLYQEFKNRGSNETEPEW